MTSTFRDVPMFGVRAVGDGQLHQPADRCPVPDLASGPDRAAVPGDRLAGHATRNAVFELTVLWASRPRPNTDPIAEAEQTAAWYREKGRVHELLAEQAEQAGAVDEQRDEQRHAAAAYEHARELLIEAEAKRAQAEAEEATRAVPMPVGVSVP